ncbi:ankyrin repeat domain-containing protein, partial [Maricaulis maris]|uniref:ankyrin repeat domain-containing protein n=1 Tax=Maricaulis maris TaxID=74318 RepID=UPI001473F28A
MTLSLGQLSNQVFNACADFGTGEMPTLGLFAAAAVVDGGTSLGGYLAVKAGQSLLSHAERQRGLTLGSNHTLLSLVYTAKWSAVREIARELDADGTAKFSQNRTLKEIYDTAAYALKHPPGTVANSRDAALIAKVGFWSRLGHRLTGQTVATRFDDSDLEGFHESDRTLLRQASTVLSREAGNRPDAAAIEGFRDAAGAAAAEVVLEALQARIFPASLDDGGAKGGQDFLDRFHDPKRGWAATFRVLLKGALEDPKQDATTKRFLLSFTAKILDLTASTHALVQDLTERLRSLQAQIQAQGVVLDQVDDGVQRLIRLAEPDLFLTRDGRETNFSANDAHVAYFLDFVFTARKSEFTGRDAEFRALLEFLGPDEEACRWWQIAGDAGQGKSRLALELIDLALINNWHAGFLSWGELSSRAVDWESIRIDRPTLIVVDYVAAPDKGAACARLLAQLIQRGRAGGLDWPVRVLFVERAPFRGGHTAEGGGNEALWFAPFRKNIGVLDTEAVCCNTDTALWLGPLHDDALLSIGQSWLASHELEALNEAEIERFKRLIAAKEGGVLDRADRARRPLLAMVFADLIRREEGAAEISLAGALKLSLQAERTRFWEESQSVAFKPSSAAVRLACLVNIVGTLDPARHGDVLGRRDEDYYGTAGEGWEKTFEQAWVLLGRNVTEGLDGEWPAFTAREPDLFAEYFLDWSASFFPPVERSNPASHLGPILEDAWCINPRATLEFLVRLSEDADDLGMRDVFNALAAVPLPEGADFPSLAELLPGHGDGPAERMLFASYVGLASLCDAVLAQAGPSQLDACVNPAGSTVFPLLFAAQNGHGAIVAALLAAGAEANRVDEQDGGFPLLMASEHGHGAIVEALVKAGAEVNRVNEQDGTFPLLQASQEGHGAIVEALLAAGAEVNRVNEQTGTFPLLMASQEGHGAI